MSGQKSERPERAGRLERHFRRLCRRRFATSDSATSDSAYGGSAYGGSAERPVVGLPGLKPREIREQDKQMALFTSSRYFSVTPPDLERVARDVMDHFRRQGFEVACEPIASRGWKVSISRGDAFKAVLGMKTALNVEIEPYMAGVMARAHVGLFELQAIPTALSVFVFPPVALAQIWGMVQQFKLDDEALDCVERSLLARAGGSTLGASQCPRCGAAIQTPGKFCAQCGNKISAT
jgi:hypothetical protein